MQFFIILGNEAAPTGMPAVDDNDTKKLKTSDRTPHPFHSLGYCTQA
jgi:hypothetical protein